MFSILTWEGREAFGIREPENSKCLQCSQINSCSFSVVDKWKPSHLILTLIPSSVPSAMEGSLNTEKFDAIQVMEPQDIEDAKRCFTLTACVCGR